MATVAAEATNDDRKQWLMRPVNWASHVSWFAAFFGAIYYWNGVVDAKLLIIGLIAALAVTSGLLIWGIRRMHIATRGY